MKRNIWHTLLPKYYWMGIVLVLFISSCSQETDQLILDEVPTLTNKQQEALNYYDETALLLTELSKESAIRQEVLGVTLLNYEMTDMV